MRTLIGSDQEAGKHCSSDLSLNHRAKLFPHIPTYKRRFLMPEAWPPAGH